MNQTKQALLNMYQKKIDRKEKFEDIKKHIISHQGEQIFFQLEEHILEMFNKKQKYQEKNKKYFMLLCNPKLWGEGTDFFEVNELLSQLNENDVEPWKINKQTLDKKMTKGSVGIIKVGEDGRTIDERIDLAGNIVNKLEAGIYAIFKVVGEETYFRNDECFVDIVITNNLFSKNKIIPKKDSINILGSTTYETKSSKKLDQYLFDKVTEFIEDNI